MFMTVCWQLTSLCTSIPVLSAQPYSNTEHYFKRAKGNMCECVFEYTNDTSHVYITLFSHVGVPHLVQHNTPLALPFLSLELLLSLWGWSLVSGAFLNWDSKRWNMANWSRERETEREEQANVGRSLWWCFWNRAL